MSDGRRMIGIHMRQHALLLLAGKGIGQRHLIEPVNRAKATDLTPAHRLQAPEIEVVNPVIILRGWEVAVIASGSRRDLCFIL